MPMSGLSFVSSSGVVDPEQASVTVLSWMLLRAAFCILLHIDAIHCVWRVVFQLLNSAHQSVFDVAFAQMLKLFTYVNSKEEDRDPTSVAFSTAPRQPDLRASCALA